MRHFWKLLVSALVVGFIGLSSVHAITFTPDCGEKVLPGDTAELTGPLHCTSGQKAILLKGGTLDCKGYAIYGNRNPQCLYSNPSACARVSTPPTTKPNRNGVVVASNKASRGSTIKNCTIRSFDIGIVVPNRYTTIEDTTTEYNMHYGASQTGYASFGTTWDGVTFNANGDEGLHIDTLYKWSSLNCAGSSDIKPNTVIKNSTASNNGREGWYLLWACNVHLGGDPNDTHPEQHGNISASNGLYTADGPHAGVYIKHSPLNTVQYMDMGGDFMQVIGNSDNNTLGQVTMTDGYVRLQSQQASTTNKKDPGYSPTAPAWTWPSNNGFTNICVDNSGASGRTKGYYFTGVTNGSNSFKGGQVKLSGDLTDKFAVYAESDSNSTPDHTTGNSIGVTDATYTVGTFVDPSTLNDSNHGCKGKTSNNTFSLCNLQTSTAPGQSGNPACY